MGGPCPAEAAADGERSDPKAFPIAKETYVQAHDPECAMIAPTPLLWIPR